MRQTRLKAILLSAICDSFLIAARRSEDDFETVTAGSCSFVKVFVQYSCTPSLVAAHVVWIRRASGCFGNVASRRERWKVRSLQKLKGRLHDRMCDTYSLNRRYWLDAIINIHIEVPCNSNPVATRYGYFADFMS